MSTQEEIIEMAREAGFKVEFDDYVYDHWNRFEAFAKLVEAKRQADIDTLHAMYELVCKQRDELMDQQRAMVAAMRGQIQ